MAGFNPGANNTDTNTNTNLNSNTNNPQGFTGNPAGGNTQPKVGILGGNSFFGSVSNNPTIVRVVDFIRNFLREVNEPNLEIIPIDGASRGLRMSGIALAYPWASATKGHDLYLTYFLLFEETLAERGNLFNMEINQQQQQVLVTADDWVTADYLTRISEVTALSVKKQGAEITPVGFDIVNRQTSANPNETAVYGRLVSIAGEAFAHYIEYVLGEKAREKNTIKDIMAGRSLTMNLDTSGVQEFNLVDQPVRSDFVATISAKEAATGTANGIFDTGIIPLTATAGYIDVSYFEMSDAERINLQNGLGQFGNVASQYQRFVATAVITEIKSLRNFWEIDSIVNAFLSVIGLTENNQWAALFQRRYSNSSGARLRDVGYLPLEVDPSAGVIDTSSTAYDELQHMKTMSTLFRPRFDFAIELPRKSCYGFFRQLIRGSTEVGSASYRAFIKGLHEYTNGFFPAEYSQPIFTLDKRPVLMGNYLGRGAHGNTRHDVRDYEDYLTVLTQVGQTDINTVKDFDAALAGLNGKSLEERTTTMFNIIERMAGEVTLTGKGDRYNITGDFMQTLLTACKSANLNIQTRTVGAMYTGSTGRRTSDSLGAAFQMSGQNVFSQGGSGLGGNSDGLGGGLNLTFGLK